MSRHPTRWLLGGLLTVSAMLSACGGGGDDSEKTNVLTVNQGTARVPAGTYTLDMSDAAAAPAVTAVIPPAADPVSLQTAISLSAHGAEHEAVATQGVTELGRAGGGVTEAGISYATVKRWSAGHLPVPEYAASIVELLEGVPTFLRPKRWSR